MGGLGSGSAGGARGARVRASREASDRGTSLGHQLREFSARARDLGLLSPHDSRISVLLHELDVRTVARLVEVRRESAPLREEPRQEPEKLMYDRRADQCGAADVGRKALAAALSLNCQLLVLGARNRYVQREISEVFRGSAWPPSWPCSVWLSHYSSVSTPHWIFNGGEPMAR